MSIPSINIEQVQSVTGGELHLNNSSHKIITQLLTDSRKVVNAESSLFFAINGDNHNGHEFISDLINAGVFNFIISDKTAWKETYTANAIVVTDPLLAMQQLAASHRNRFRIPVIGITGSNGKTVVKEWLYQLLREDKNIVRSPKSYNSQIGVPL
ncbi:MAG: Mur ligase family protein, partial [Bacteroidota bacterium]